MVYVEYTWCIFRMHVWWPLRQRPGVVLADVSGSEIRPNKLFAFYMWSMLSIYVVYVQYTWCMLIVLGICLIYVQHT